GRRRRTEHTSRGRAAPPSPSLPARAPASCAPHPPVRHIVEQGGGIEEEAVHAVEHAPMAGNELPRVLGADAPLEGGFREIAELPDDAQEEANEQRVPRAEPRKEPALGRERGQR